MTSPRPVTARTPMHVVAHRAPGDAARAGQVGGDHAAERLRVRCVPEQRGKIGRLGDQVLAMLGQRRLDLVQRRAGARGNDQFLRRIERDAGQAGGGQRSRCLHRPQHAGLGAGAAASSSGSLAAAAATGSGDPGLIRVRARSGVDACRASASRLGDAAAQRKHLAGVQQPARIERGLDAALLLQLHARRTAPASGRASRRRRRARRSGSRRPRRRVSGCRRRTVSALCEAGRIVGVEHDQRMQIAVAGVEDVGDLQPVARPTSRRCGAARRAAGWSGSRRPCTDSPG